MMNIFRRKRGGQQSNSSEEKQQERQELWARYVDDDGNVTEHYFTGDAKNVIQTRGIHGNIHLNWNES